MLRNRERERGREGAREGGRERMCVRVVNLMHTPCGKFNAHIVW